MPTLRARKQQDVAAAIRASREASGLTREALAERLAFPRDYMGDLESGKANVFAARLFRVLHELGITITMTYGDEDADS